MAEEPFGGDRSPPPGSPDFAVWPPRAPTARPTTTSDVRDSCPITFWWSRPSGPPSRLRATFPAHPGDRPNGPSRGSKQELVVGRRPLAMPVTRKTLVTMGALSSGGRGHARFGFAV